MKKGKEKRRKITLKIGKRPLKCISLGYNLFKKFAGGSTDPTPARELGKKMKKGKEKRRKITLKKGEKALKMHLFVIIRRKKVIYKD